MLIQVPCPKCTNILKISDDAAGETIPCRSCGADVVVPGPGANPEADSDDRPQPKPKKKKKKKPVPQGNPRLKWGLIAGAAGLALLIVAYIGYQTYRTFNPPPDKEIAGVGWYRVQSDDWFTAYFPGNEPEYEKYSFRLPAALVRGSKPNDDPVGWGIKSWIRKHEGREYAIIMFDVSGPGAEEKMAEKAAQDMRVKPGPGVVTLVDEPVTVNGVTGRKLGSRSPKETKVSMLFGLGNSRILGILVTSDQDFDHTDPLVVSFFENLTLKN